MSRLSTIELYKEDMKFCAGHFTVFSSTVRENLHGHNYNVFGSFTTSIQDEGLSFDYRFYKAKLYALCSDLDETVLLPGRCKYLTITEQGDYYHVKFDQEVIIFLKRDVTILPITNITVEELSNWILSQLVSDPNELNINRLSRIEIKVFSRPGQSGSSIWEKNQTFASNTDATLCLEESSNV
jgi:6-pyruvoyltetrahydropterin/6-carboxytetrahydropterin synthase